MRFLKVFLSTLFLFVVSYSQTTFNISGNIYGFHNYCMNGSVVITFSNGGGTSSTGGSIDGPDGQGRFSKSYTRTIAVGWVGTSTPALYGYSFTPVSRTYTALVSNQINQDFTVVDTLPPQIYIKEPLSVNTYYVNSIDTFSYYVYDNSKIVVKRVRFISSDGGVTYPDSVVILSTQRTTMLESDSLADTTNMIVAVKKYTFTRTTPSTQYRIQIKVYDVDGNVGVATSGQFVVADTSKPTVSVSAPVKNYLWNVGTAQNITWTALDNVGVVSRAIYLSTNNGTNYSLIDSAGTNTGTYSYTVPSTPTPQCKIMVRAYDSFRNVGIGYSDSLFKIVASPGIVPVSHAVTPKSFDITQKNGGLFISIEKDCDYRLLVCDVYGRQLVRKDAHARAGYWSYTLPGVSGVFIASLSRNDKQVNRVFFSMK